MPWRLAACVALLGVCGCRDNADIGTGLFVTVTFAGATVDQLEFTLAAPQGGGAILPATLRPAAPAAPLASPQTVAIYLGDELAGAAVTCGATAFASGGRLALAASSAAVVRRGALVSVELGLAAAGPRKADGGACAAASECASDLCVEGVCCASACDGACESCKVPGHEGTCAPVAAGTRDGRCAEQGAASCGFDGACDGSGACRRYPLGVACGAPACDPANGSGLRPAAACDGQGACLPAPAVDCAPFACDAAGASAGDAGAAAAGPRCRTECAGDGDCAPGRTCVAGSCGARTKQANGTGCQAAGDCASGFCRDGVCCASACDGACTSCNQTGFLGTCRPVEAGKADPRRACADRGVTTCGQSGLCDGKGGCALYPSGASCASGSCVGRLLLGPKRCDGKGACQSVPVVDCARYACDARAGACFTSCTGAAQCATNAGATCAMNVCR